jgi:hypothetical protein
MNIWKPQEFRLWRSPRVGQSNPERMSCGLSAPVSLLLPTVGIFSYDLMLPKDGLPADGAKDPAALSR